MRTSLNKKTFRKLVDDGKIILTQLGHDIPIAPTPREYHSIFNIFKIPGIGSYRHNNKYVDLGVITCHDLFKIRRDLLDDGEYKVFDDKAEFCFTSELPVREGFEEVKKSDIINIQTMLDIDYPETNFYYTESLNDHFPEIDWETHDFSYSHINRIINEDIANNYLVTLLIELDPL